MTEKFGAKAVWEQAWLPGMLATDDGPIYRRGEFDQESPWGESLRERRWQSRRHFLDPR